MESFLLFAFISLQIIVNKNRYGRTANPPSYGQAKRRSRQILRPHTDKTIVWLWGLPPLCRQLARLGDLPYQTIIYILTHFYGIFNYSQDIYMLQSYYD